MTNQNRTVVMTDQIPEVNFDQPKRLLTVHWDEQTQFQYHYVWLRHAGRCSYGMPNDTSVKIDLLPSNPENLKIECTSIENNLLTINWLYSSDTTKHDLTVLKSQAYDDKSRQVRKHRPSLWQADNTSDIPCFSFNQLSDTEAELALLLAVRDFGLARISGVSTEAGSIESVSRMFGPTHVNNYGGIFNVRSDANKLLGSNTGVYLPPHTDESYRHEAPGISMFHCLESSEEGGESVLVDGFSVAAALKEVDPDSYRVLTQVPIFFQRYAPPEEDMRSHTRILVEDIDGDLIGLRWTDRTLPPQDLPFDWVEPVYQALYQFRALANDPKFSFQYRMSPGDLHVFDNHRVLHGRQPFDASKANRHLQQCSVNRDEFHSSLRVLAAVLGNPASELVMAGGAGG
jgi:gamma-butyrobetaine dioxygenase